MKNDPLVWWVGRKLHRITSEEIEERLTRRLGRPPHPFRMIDPDIDLGAVCGECGRDESEHRWG